MTTELSQNIIEETIDGIEIYKIIDIFYSEKVTSKDNKLTIDYDTVGKSCGFSKELCNDLYAYKDSTAIYIWYKDEELSSFYRTVEVEDSSEKKEIYHIYRYNFCLDLIKNKKQFKNPIIINDKKIIEFKELQNIFSSILEEFKIIDSKENIEYESIFNKVNNINLENITGETFTENFKYYFKHPNSGEKFVYKYSPKRTKLHVLGEKEKVKAICGNFGIGKSTSLISAKITHPEIIYFNVKALMENKNNIFVWKYQIMLKEIAYYFKKSSDSTEFTKLKNSLEEKLLIWECIVFVVEFVLSKKMKAKIILDQYKEYYDKNYYYIKIIIKKIDKNDNDIVKLIISSSINNKDVRDALLRIWFKEKLTEKKEDDLTLPYIYFNDLFRCEELIEADTTISEKKKFFIKKYFNNIPLFYLEIKYKGDGLLDSYKTEQMKKIEEKIQKFYDENKLSLEDIMTLLNYRQRIGKILNNDDLYKLLKLLPLKYFTLNNNKVNFYFSLVENAFDNYLTDRICELLKYPIINIKESSIGDLLEYVLINDLKNNKFDNFDEIFMVDSIWDLHNIESSNADQIENKNILICQKEPKAKYIDFGILNKSDKLILIQCKKALAQEPKNYPNRTTIYENRNKINSNFKSKFNIKIKSIYFLYITGISPYYDEKSGKNDFKTWGNKESENFKIIEGMCEKGECLLVYYDPVNKQNYLKNSIDELTQVSSLINLTDNLEGILIEENIDNYEKMHEEEIFKIDINKEIYENMAKKYKNIRPKKDNSDEFFDMKDLSKIRINNISINTKVFAVCDNPNHADFMIENVYIGFKRNRTKYFYLTDDDKGTEIYELNDKNIFKKDLKIEDLISKEKIDKCYYMKKKINK